MTIGRRTYDLPLERPASIDDRGARVYQHPAKVSGKWRTRRTAVYSVLLLVFLLLPWIEIAGTQSILLDVGRRRFAFFGLTFWAHDAPILLFVIGGFSLALLFFTAVFGRVWCGWACPQTVFIDMVFRRIEGWIEGSPQQQRKLDKAPWSGKKVAKRSLKWALFTLASLVIAHSFLAYFVGTDRLFEMVRSSPFDHPASFLVMASAAGLTLFDFGWFREQFCIVACPYGRLQNVLMDQSSLAPLYDERRGEPRKGTQPPGEPFADCVNCYRCVQVCPTGVDIRRGMQMECIACTACIDACDDIMTRVKKPLGLIRYASIESMGGESPARRRWSPRAFAYLALLVAALVGLAVTVAGRTSFQMTVNRAPDAPYSKAGQSGIVNHVRVHMANQGFDDVPIVFEVADGGARYTVVTAKSPVMVPGGESVTVDAFIMFDIAALDNGRRSVVLEAHNADVKDEPVARWPMKLLGPGAAPSAP